MHQRPNRARWIESKCMQDNCFGEIAACETNRKCAADENKGLRTAILECEEQNCITSAPTSQPTNAPTAVPTSLELPFSPETPGLHFLAGSQNFTELDYLEFYPAFQMNSIPINPDKVVGSVVAVESLCDTSQFLPPTASPTTVLGSLPTMLPFKGTCSILIHML